MLPSAKNALKLSVFCALLACAGDASTSPPTVRFGPALGDPSLVIAFTLLIESSPLQCWLTLATTDGRIRPMPSVCGDEPTWSPDGARLAYVFADDLWIVRANGTGATMVPHSAFVRSPAWSPDGSRLVAFDGPRASLTLVPLDGSVPTVLSSTRSTVGDPDWSPDGRSILYSRANEIYEVDVASDVSRLVMSPRFLLAQSPRWSPDGATIAIAVPLDGTIYVVGTGQQRGMLPESAGIWILNRDGTQRRQVVNEAIGQMSWSPDGSKLVYTSESTDLRRRGVYIVNASGNNPVPLLLSSDTLNAYGAEWLRRR